MGVFSTAACSASFVPTFMHIYHIHILQVLDVSSCSLFKGGAEQVADALMSTVRDLVSRRGRDIDREKGLAVRGRGIDCKRGVEEGDGDLGVERKERELYAVRREG